MEVGLIIIAVIILAAAVNGQIYGPNGFSALVSRDIFGQGSTSHGFIVWLGALIVIGAVFRLANLPEAGRVMIVLLMLAYLLGNKNLLPQLTAAVTGGGPSAPNALPPLAGSVPGGPQNIAPGASGRTGIGTPPGEHPPLTV